MTSIPVSIYLNILHILPQMTRVLMIVGYHYLSKAGARQELPAGG